uniref:Shisa N-terminal domain-containing protein n=1 Tax=Gasterosteus aculeatus aculeatus TaxID=481459 RepID=A0AAQ4Q358_GASAC
MSSVCGSYYGEDGVFVAGFTCPKADSDAAALFCCGFNNLKYCCDDPNGFFPNNFGAIALSIAVMLAFALLFSLCILCYFIITTEPIDLDNGLELQATEVETLSSFTQISHAHVPAVEAGEPHQYKMLYIESTKTRTKPFECARWSTRLEETLPEGQSGL